MSTNRDVEVVRQENTALMKRPASVATVIPLADIYETDNAYVVLLDMPGATKESISITMDKSSLVVRSELAPRYSEVAKVLHNEIVSGVYHRNFNLSDSIDRDTVDAHYEHGVLTIKLFKKEEVKPREIRIK